MSATTAPVRVLLVDDRELFRRGLALLLGQEKGIEVVGQAVDGPGGIDLAVETTPDVVLLDVRMPTMTGLEACAAIKAAVPTTKVVMLTASDEKSDLYASLKAGASGYLLKDSSVEEVTQGIRVVADGQSLISPAMAMKLVDEFASSSTDRVAEFKLTRSELKVLRLVARGLSNREVGEHLTISENTVKNHVRNILKKLKLHSRMEAVMFAVRTKLVDLDD